LGHRSLWVLLHRIQVPCDPVTVETKSFLCFKVWRSDAAFILRCILTKAQRINLCPPPPQALVASASPLVTTHNDWDDEEEPASKNDWDDDELPATKHLAGLSSPQIILAEQLARTISFLAQFDAEAKVIASDAVNFIFQI
jgi:hypothetical protein